MTPGERAAEELVDAIRGQVPIRCRAGWAEGQGIVLVIPHEADARELAEWVAEGGAECELLHGYGF